jgi:hypothetical protein
MTTLIKYMFTDIGKVVTTGPDRTGRLNREPDQYPVRLVLKTVAQMNQNKTI